MHSLFVEEADVATGRGTEEPHVVVVMEQIGSALGSAEPMQDLDAQEGKESKGIN